MDGGPFLSAELRFRRPGADLLRPRQVVLPLARLSKHSLIDVGAQRRPFCQQALDRSPSSAPASIFGAPLAAVR